METLNDLAIKAFEKGSDNFGETVTGIKDELHHVKFDGRYVINLHLKQSDGHPCTSGIGLYPTSDFKKITFISGHRVFDVDMTPEYEKQFKYAKEHNSVDI